MNKTKKRNVKRHSRKVTKTQKRKYRNKKYDGGNDDGGNKDYENQFGFTDSYDQNDQQTSCPQTHAGVNGKEKICDNCIAYLQKIFIIKYNELKDYINGITNDIKTNHSNNLINKESYDIYDGHIDQLNKQLDDIYKEAIRSSKTYTLNQWINFINRVNGKKGEIVSRMDEQIFGYSANAIGNVRKNEPLPKKSRKPFWKK